MEPINDLCLEKQECPEDYPYLFKHVASKSIEGFDNVEVTDSLNRQDQPTCPPHSDSSIDITAAKGLELTALQDQVDTPQTSHFPHSNDVSISLPCSPLGVRRVLFSDEVGSSAKSGTAGRYASSLDYIFEKPKHAKFYSQPMPYKGAVAKGNVSDPTPHIPKNPRIDKFKDKRFNSFKTWSGKPDRQLSYIWGKQPEAEPQVNDSQLDVAESVPVERYFAALRGPELETLRDSEELLLPEDKKWPFLLRFPVSSFGICLGISSQAILWKTIATSSSTRFLHINIDVNLILWCISIALVAIVSIIYSLKIIFFFEAVRREYYHPIRVNFFFAPWISLLFLGLGVPPSYVKILHTSVWYILMTPLFCLELKIYGQWMSGGRRRLSKVANPSNHLAVVGNFVGSLLGASMGLKEGPIFFFAIGVAHYIVLFVTLYQRLPTNETLPKELHPVFFLFVAAPSVASMAWTRIQESFDYGSRICYFIAMFLYVTLAVRVNFFRGFKFSLAWWAYTFPMTGAAIATIRYSMEVKNPLTQTMAVILSVISTVAVFTLLVSTVIHAFVLQDLFPNDIAIAISRRRVKNKNSVNLRSTKSDTAVLDNSLNPTTSVDPSDIETCAGNGNNFSV